MDVITRRLGQRPSLKDNQPAPARRKLLPTGGGQGNARLYGTPSGGRAGQGGLASGVQQVQAAPYQEAESDPRHGGAASRTGNRMMANGGLIRHDRHVYGNVGTEKQQAHPNPTGGQGYAPLADGPARPSFGLVHRSINARYGTTGTRFLDNNGPFAMTATTDGRAHFLAIQDGTPWTTKFGGAPGLTHVYGLRGLSGVQGPELGSPQDGPQKIRGGVPHGLHTRIPTNAELTKARRAATPRQTQQRRSRPANSKVAGQSYSQTVQHQDSTAVTRLPRIASGRQPGMLGRGLNR